MFAGANSEVFVGVCVGALMFSGADSMCSWCRFHGVCWCQGRFGFFVGAEALVFAGVEALVFAGADSTYDWCGFHGVC